MDYEIEDIRPKLEVEASEPEPLPPTAKSGKLEEKKTQALEVTAKKELKSVQGDSETENNDQENNLGRGENAEQTLAENAEQQQQQQPPQEPEGSNDLKETAAAQQNFLKANNKTNKASALKKIQPSKENEEQEQLGEPSELDANANQELQREENVEKFEKSKEAAEEPAATTTDEGERFLKQSLKEQPSKKKAILAS